MTVHNEICVLETLLPGHGRVPGKGQAECRETSQAAVLRVQAWARAAVEKESKGMMSPREPDEKGVRGGTYWTQRERERQLLGVRSD